MYSAEPLATRRTLANVKSSATTPRQPSVPNLIWSGIASVSTPRSAADFAASAAGAKEPTSTRGSASRRCVTERAQEATPASAPISGPPRNRKIPWGESAPGRLGRWIDERFPGRTTDVDHRDRSRLEIVDQRFAHLQLKAEGFNRRRHVREPRIALCLPDCERLMPEAQPRVAATGAVRGRSAPVLNEEQSQALGSPGQVFLGIDT